jgi:predicted transcriptional regulator
MPSGTKSAPSQLTKAIARRIENEKSLQGFTNSELSRQSGISRPLLVNMLQGTKHWDIDQLDAVCKILELDIVEVIATAEAQAKVQNVRPLRKNLNLEVVDLEQYEKAADHNNHDSGEPEIP